MKVVALYRYPVKGFTPEPCQSLTLGREGRVDDILSRHAAVCAERDRLQGQLAEAQARIAEIRGQLETYEKERAQVRARVESILGRLEGLDLS